MDICIQKDIYKELLFFNNFMLCICIIMPFVKYLPKYIMESDTMNRKINQYTNWNLFLILCNHMLFRFGIENLFICKFIALNSLQIFLLYHGFIIYDKGILFDITDKQSRPFVPINIPKYNKLLIQTEYFIINIFIHILPAYYYIDYLIKKQAYGNEINMALYTILFKFFWALNVFGSFNVVSIYLPSFNGCVITLFNAIVASDYSIGFAIQTYKNMIA